MNAKKYRVNARGVWVGGWALLTVSMSEGPTRESVQAACAAMREGFTLEGYSVEMAS